MKKQVCGQLTFFQEGSHALPSPAPGSEKARLMTATSGLKCLESSGSCGPLGLSEKMLLALYPWGSTMRFLTWKTKVTAQGRLLFRLVPSKPRTSENGCLLWATPTTMDHLPQRSPEALLRQAATSRKGRTRPANLREQVYPETMKMWPTPVVPNGGRTLHHVEEWRGNSAYHNGKKVQVDLAHAIRMWPTPTSRDYKGTNSLNHIENGIEKNGKGHLGQLANAVLWATPTARGWTGASHSPFRQGSPDLQTAVNGALNPDWVEVLMGFPVGYTILED